MQQWSSDNALHMHMHLVRPPPTYRQGHWNSPPDIQYTTGQLDVHITIAFQSRNYWNPAPYRLEYPTEYPREYAQMCEKLS